jgi:hypothetical protein
MTTALLCFRGGIGYPLQEGVMVRHPRATVNRHDPDRSVRRNLDGAWHATDISRAHCPCHV